MRTINSKFKIIKDTVHFIKNDTSLRARLSRGSAWLASASFFERALRLCRTMILTRLLLREDFGLMAFGVGVTLAFETLSEVGVRQFIIQSPNAKDTELLNVAWWVESFRRIIFALVALLSAPYIADFVDQPNLTPIIQIISISIIFRGLQSPKIHILEKDLQYRKWVLIIQGSKIIGSIITVILAVFYPSAIILAIGYVIESAFQCLFSYVVCFFVPSVKIDKLSLQKALKFATGIVGTPLIVFLIHQLDIFIIGKILGMSILGGYSIALGLANIPAMLFSSTFGKLLLPSYSEKKENMKDFENFVILLTRYISIFGIPLIVCLTLISKPLLSLLYGKQYVEFSVVFSILCIYMLIRSMASILSGICYALGQPEIDRRSMILRGLALLLSIYPATIFLGAPGTALAFVFSIVVYLAYHVNHFRIVFMIKTQKYLLTPKPGIYLALILVILFNFINLMLPNMKNSNILTISLGLFLTFSLLGFYMLYRTRRILPRRTS